MPKPYGNRGVAYGKKGEFERAIRDLNKAIAFKPNLAETYNSRGIVYDNKGNLTMLSQTIPRRSNSNQTMPKPITIVELLMVTKVSMSGLS